MNAKHGHSDTRRLWSRVRLGAVIPYIVLGALLLVVIVFVGRDIHQHIDAIEAWLKAISPWGVVAFFVLYVVLTSLFVPGSVMAIIGGALFGLAGGTLVVVVAALAAATVQYFLARHLMRNRIERMLSAKPSLLAIERAVLREQFRLQVLLRLSPLSPVMCGYLLGAAGVRFGGFFIACFALIPGLFMQVYFGHAGKHLAHMAGRDDRSVLMHDALLVGGLLLFGIVMLFVARTARKAVQEAIAEGAEMPGSDSDAIA